MEEAKDEANPKELLIHHESLSVNDVPNQENLVKFRSVKKPYNLFKYVWEDRQPFDKQKTSSETLSIIMCSIKPERAQTFDNQKDLVTEPGTSCSELVN